MNGECPTKYIFNVYDKKGDEIFSLQFTTPYVYGDKVQAEMYDRWDKACMIADDRVVDADDLKTAWKT